MQPKYPLYIPSKGRYERRPTSDYLSFMKVSHYIVVEPQEVELYEKHTKGNKFVTILAMDLNYKNTYKKLDGFGLTKSTGPGPARNFAWEHSKKNGFERHWVMDDNIYSFKRTNQNRQINVSDGSMFKAMEDFCDRYTNVGMAGPNYFMFIQRKQKHPPFICNTRIYSCNLIKNDLPFRWRGRYNEDTILSLDMLKAGLCTVQFNAFLQEKMTTQTMGGGNTEAFYAGEGTYLKSKMLIEAYPQYCRLVHKFGRIHHTCNYRVFKNQLIYKKDVKLGNGNNEYGFKLRDKE